MIHRPLASAVNAVPHLAAFHDIVKKRLDDIDKSIALVNMIDTVPAVALPLLARQFHAMGFEGWRFASTDAERRKLLRKSIELHRFKGTPWSIKEALRTIGYDHVEFQEGVDKVLDGTWVLDGSVTLGSEGWAKFRAFVWVDDLLAITTEISDLIVGIILEYKPARCHLMDITFYSNTGQDYFTIDTDGWTIDDDTFTIDKTING